MFGRHQSEAVKIAMRIVTMDDARAACRTLAEAGCTALQIMSITGHTNIKDDRNLLRRRKQKGGSPRSWSPSSRT